VEDDLRQLLLVAEQMYQSRDFSAMPILADAIDDAGCDNQELLTAMRTTDYPWYRGCWIVDRLTSRP